MTVIAYKDGIIAADCLVLSPGDLKRRGRKLERLPDGRVVAGAGDAVRCEAIIYWIKSGCDMDSFPTQKPDDGFANVIVVSLDGSIVQYQNAPYPLRVYDTFFAIGSGRDFALAAMHMGADAVKAIKVATNFSSVCGFGVDFFDLETETRPFDLNINGEPLHED